MLAIANAKVPFFGEGAPPNALRKRIDRKAKMIQRTTVRLRVKVVGVGLGDEVIGGDGDGGIS